MSFSVIGTPSKTIILIMESHKMSGEFQVSATVQLGQPVVLNTDGTVAPFVAGTNKASDILGYAYTSGYAPNLITVFMRAFTRQYAVSGAAVTAGPGTYNGFNTTPLVGDGTYTDPVSYSGVPGTSGYNQYINTTDATLMNGFILTPASAANKLIQVALH